MIKRIALLLIVLILSLSTAALADEPGSGIIEGVVVNKTVDGGSVANQDVTLKTFLDDTEVNSNSTRTDAEGRFVFDGLSTEPGHSYYAVLTFQEAEYYGEWLSFDDGETTKSTEVIVYDSTTDDGAIKVATAHTIIYIEQGSLLVKEYFVFVNQSDRTYIGLEEATTEGNRETLQFALPKDIDELRLGQGLMECCVSASEEGFIDSMAVLPSGREVAYSYLVSYDSGSYTFSQRVNYPTASFDLLVQGEDTEVAVSQLSAEEPLDIEGARFSHFTGQGLAPGDTLVIELSGLPQTSNQRFLTWIAMILGVLILGAGSIYLLRKKRPSPVKAADSLEESRQRLLVELAQLDDDFEGGKLPERAYQRVRRQKKAQLIKLMQRPKEESGNS